MEELQDLQVITGLPAGNTDFVVINLKAVLFSLSSGRE